MRATKPNIIVIIIVSGLHHYEYIVSLATEQSRVE